MASKFKSIACWASFIFVGVFCSAGISPSYAESETMEMSWEELEQKYDVPAETENSKQQSRRALEEQLSKQFASLSRGLSKLPHPPNMENKEISFGRPAKKRG